MKNKLKLLSLLLVVFFALTGCGGEEPKEAEQEEDPQKQEEPAPKEEEPAPSKLENIEFADGQLYAVAFLGYGQRDEATFKEMQDAYLDEADLPIHYVSEGDIYLVIPRYEGMDLSISTIDVDTSEKTKIFEEKNAGPFLIQCNVSDIIQDAEITLSKDSESASFTPYQSLKDGTIQVGEKGLNLIPDEPNE